MTAASIAIGVAMMPMATTTFAADKTMTGGFAVGPGGFPGNCNPLMATTGYMALTLAYEPLVVYDKALQKVVGKRAASYDISADRLTYTFKLVPTAKWRDGQPFTSKTPDAGGGYPLAPVAALGLCIPDPLS
ncbi:hypothetical protein HGO38_27705 [Rhizobium sp. CG5]|nr:hypothetical protein [Rhizobium sp. CG5]